MLQGPPGITHRDSAQRKTRYYACNIVVTIDRLHDKRQTEANTGICIGTCMRLTSVNIIENLHYPITLNILYTSTHDIHIPAHDQHSSAHDDLDFRSTFLLLFRSFGDCPCELRVLFLSPKFWSTKLASLMVPNLKRKTVRTNFNDKTLLKH